MSAPAPPSRPVHLLAAAATCFFVSGLAALLYEVVWLRLLGLVFGHTVHAVTTVLAAYMAGLALGSWLAGRWGHRVARPLRAYAILEAAIGLLCLATPALLQAAQALYLALQRAWQPGALGSGLVQFGLSTLVLVPPTALMGATLPLLARAVVGDGRLAAPRVGTLYALNTWGAVAGTVATGFLLLPNVGLRVTIGVGVALNLAVAAAALWLDRRVRRAEAADAAGAATAQAGPALTPLQATVALVGIGLSGAASMAYEVAWTRALSLTLGSSTYAFSAMLTTFLVGLALGSLAAAALLRKRPLGLGAFGLAEVGVGLSAVALLPAFGRLPEALLAVFSWLGVSHGSALGAQFGLGFLLMIVPTVLVGATFPLVIAAVGSTRGRVERDVGRVYSANTVGTIAGAVVAGFLLVPAIGIQATVKVAAGANLLAGLAALLATRGEGRRARLAGAGAVLAFGLLAVLGPSWDPRLMTAGVPVYAARMLAPDGPTLRAEREVEELLLYREGLSTTVAVTRAGAVTSLSVNGKVDASTGRDMGTQSLLGHLGAVLLPEPGRALVIGLASGVTVGAVAQHPFQAIDVAELEPAMRQASSYFRRENHDALADPRVRVLDGDGRHVLALARQPYDLIVSEPSNPWIAGVASLFTREFYRSARSHLAGDGVMVQWLQAYAIFGRDMQMVVRTFREVFPHVTVWSATKGDLLLVATPGAACLDLDLVRRRLAGSPAMAEDFQRFGWLEDGLALRYLLGEEEAGRYAEGAALNTDDLPILEFSAPRAMYDESGLDNLATLRSFRRSVRPCLRGAGAALTLEPAGRLRAARAFWREDENELALAELYEPGALAAPDPALQLERDRLLVLLGRLPEAEAELERLAGASRPHPPVAALAGVVRALSGSDVAPALQETLAPSRAGPFAVPSAYGHLLLELAVQRRDPGLLSLGAEVLETAAHREPWRYDVLNNLGLALVNLGRLEEAEPVLRQAIRLAPAHPSPHLVLGGLLERQGRRGEAEEAFATARRLEGSPTPAPTSPR